MKLLILLNKEERKNCECKNYTYTFNVTIDFFTKSYGKFLKTKGKSITNKKLFNETKNLYDTLIDLFQNLKEKGEECIQIMKKCHSNHSEEIEDISSKLNKLDELEGKINKHFNEIKKTIPKNFEENENN